MNETEGNYITFNGRVGMAEAATVLDRTNPPTFLTLFTKLNTLQNYDIAKDYRVQQDGSSFVPTQPQNFAPSPYLKASSNKIMIQVIILGMSMTFYFIKPRLFKCNTS
jgi:hypothetical protein